MPATQKQALEYVSDQIDQGKMTVAEGNVYMVQMRGVVEVGKLTKEVRQTLNAAVKNGELGHIKKEGLKPEVYYHKNSRAAALDYRNKAEREKIEAIRRVSLHHKDI